MAGFHTVGPNYALIVSGGNIQPKVKVGGRMFVLPFIQKAQMLSLEVMTLQVNTARVYTAEGVSVSVDGVAQVKVGRSEQAIRTAAEQFLGKSVQETSEVALQTLEGQQRAILGTMTVEDIYRDRVAFAEQVREVAATDMTNMGLEIVSFSIRDIQDEQGYLEALGVRRTAEVKRDAAIGQAEAERDAGNQGRPGRTGAPGGEIRRGYRYSGVGKRLQYREGGIRSADQRAQGRSGAGILTPGGEDTPADQRGRAARSKWSSARSRSKFRCRRSPAGNGSWTQPYVAPPKPNATSWS